jgi:hypothetical protein
MKKTLLSMSLWLLAAGAHAAGWSRIDAPSADVRLYVDQSTAEKSGPGMVQLWHIADYAQPQDRDGKAYRSIKFRNEYDCDKGMVRDLLRSWHKEPMGEGLVVYWNHGPWPWTRPEAGSADETLLRATCTAK